ncbi:MAG: cytochrome c biogenesis protein CcdA [Halobacteriales archaeon]|nr:cytochrome c biogenesis protein CcdA [Halobacteriales archaeon]
MTSAVSFLGTLGLAASAGVFTFFSPCAYALLPGYVAYYVAETGGEKAPLTGAVARGGTATAGVLTVFAVLFALAVAFGNVVEPYLTPLEVLVGVVLVLFGAVLALGIDLSFHVELPERRSTKAGFFAFGVLYAVAAAGCVAPLFLSVVFRSLLLPTHEASMVLGVYAGTFGVLMLGITVVTAVGHGVGTGYVAKHVDRLVRVAGVVILLAGLGQIYFATSVTYTSPLVL